MEVPEVEKTWIRHTNQIRKLTAEIYYPGIYDTPTKAVNNNQPRVVEATVNPVKESAVGTNSHPRPKRISKAPDRLVYYK